MKRVTVIAGIMFIFIFAILPVLVGIIVETIANLITMDFISKAIYAMLLVAIICIFKKKVREMGGQNKKPNGLNWFALGFAIASFIAILLK